MTAATDDTADEAAFEAFLAGRPAPVDADGGSSAVGAFVGTVRATATVPGRPSAALAELLATGLLTDQSTPSTRTAPSAGSPPRRPVRRRRFAVFFPALLAKFLSAGAVAQAASGAGIALVAFTGAGATGVLGDDVQTTIASAVGAEDTTDVVTPDAPTADDETADAGQTLDPAEVPTPAPEAPVPTETLREPEVAQADGPVEGQTFGDWVHEAFPGGKADGRIVSRWARAKHVDLSQVEDVDGIDAPAAVAPAPAAETESETDDAEETSHGGGNGRGDRGHASGGGHSDHGNSARGHH